MKKMFIIILFCVMSFLLFTPVNAKGIMNNSHFFSFSHTIYLLDEDQEFNGISNVDDSGIDMSKYNQEQDCEGLLGDPEKEDSVAWLLQKALNIVQVVGPLLVVVLSSIDFVKVIVNGDDDAMAKAGKKLGIRLVLAAALFFIPTLVMVLLDVFGVTSDPTCGIQ